MKNIWKKYRIFPIALVLYGLFFGWTYLFVRDGAYNSGDVWLLKAYKMLGLVLLFVMLLCILCLKMYTDVAIGQPLGFWERVRRFFTLTIEKAFFITTLCFGLIYVFVLPPLSAPDEISHYISAYQLSNIVMFQESNADSGKVLIRSEDLVIEDVSKDYRLMETKAGNRVVFVKSNPEDSSTVLSQTLDEADYDYIYRHFYYGDDGREDLAVSEFPPVRSTPIPYLASAIGISLARALHLGSVYLLFFGRIANLLAFVILMTIAIKKMPMYKEIFFGVTLLPMSLHLAASFSYDGFIFAMYAIFIAYVLHLRFQAKRVGIMDLVWITCILILAAPCKIVYAPLALLAFLVPKEKFGSTKFYVMSIAVVAIGMLLSILVTNIFTIRLHMIGSTNVIWAGEESVSLGFMLHNPIKILRMIYDTFIYQMQHYHFGMIGRYLGNLDEILDISYFAMSVFTLCLLVLGFSTQGEELRLFAPQKWLIFLSMTLCIGLIEFSMLLAWTPISSQIIQGVQGRYFLPLLPLGLLLLKQKAFVFTTQKNRTALIVMCLMNVFVLIRMFGIICIRL